MSKFFKALENADRERARTLGTSSAIQEEAAVEEAAPADETVEQAPIAPNGTASPLNGASLAPSTTEAPDTSEVARHAPETQSHVSETRPLSTPAVVQPERRQIFGAPVIRRTGDSPFLRPGTGAVADLGPEAGDIDDRLVSLLQPTSFAAEQYRGLRLAIETFRRERGTQIVAISSPGREEGKTITAINLAGALGQARDARVVLVEADLRHPHVAGYLALREEPGLSGYLLDSGTSVEHVLQRSDGGAFSVIVAGAPSAMPYELLKSSRFSALLQVLRERFDFVVVDTPPVRPFPDVGILCEIVDGFVVVVRANRTPREMLRESVGTLGQDRTLGVIFNDDERIQPMPGTAADARWRSYLSRSRGGRRVA